MEREDGGMLIAAGGMLGGLRTGEAAKPPAVIPLPPGTRPTEPGWYITALQEVVEVWPRSRADQTLVVAGIMWEEPHPLVSFPAMEFIARIFLDRIGQE